MEWLGEEWKPLSSFDEAARSLYKEAVLAAYEKSFKPNNFVHGDLHGQNIMIRTINSLVEVKFVDFEWAGKNGIARYPYFKNNTDLIWHQQAVDGELITSEHDIYLINQTYDIVPRSQLNVNDLLQNLAI